MRFNGPAPELVNGRLAMIGILAAARGEALGGGTVLAQAHALAASPSWAWAGLALVVYASLVPILKGARHEAFGEQRPQLRACRLPAARCSRCCRESCGDSHCRLSQGRACCRLSARRHLHAARRGDQRARRHAGLCHLAGARVQGRRAVLLRPAGAIQCVCCCVDAARRDARMLGSCAA